MSILVTGASGGLGQYVVSELRNRIVCSILTPASSELRVHDRESVARYFKDHTIDGVVHLAAWANVDRCMTEPLRAMAVNALGTRYMVEAARVLPFVYMSTNDIFSECLDGPFDETRVPLPGMVYSWSKLYGEAPVLATGGFVVRANFFTRHCNAKQSFVDYVLANAYEGKSFGCYTNVTAAPVHASTLAKAIVDGLLDRKNSILHLCTSDSVNREEQARCILQAYGLSTDHIRPKILMDRRGRPLDARLTSVLGGIVGSVRDEITKLVKLEPL